jgi:hypothetical protein
MTITCFKHGDKTLWLTVEMQLKVSKTKMSYKEIPVRYKNRIGVSKSIGYRYWNYGWSKIIGWINTLLNNNMLQLSYYSNPIQHLYCVYFLYSLAHFNLLLNYLKSKNKRPIS